MSDIITADAAAAQQDTWNTYLKSQEIDKVFVEIVKSLIAEQPEKPIEHMIQFLATNHNVDLAALAPKAVPEPEPVAEPVPAAAPEPAPAVVESEPAPAAEAPAPAAEPEPAAAPEGGAE